MIDIDAVEKVELHCHVDGLVNAGLVRAFESRGEEAGFTVEELEGVSPVKDLDDWLNRYGPLVGGRVLNNGELVLRTLEQHVENLKRQNVIYAEIMISSINSQFPDIDRQMELYRRFRETIDAHEKGRIQVEFLIAIGRSKNRGKVERLAERAIEARKRGLICGVALAGLESASPVKPYADLFRELRRAGLKIEIHAGEWGGSESVWDTLEYGSPDRLGHGLAVFRDEKLLEHVIERDIHIEMCPTSNMILAGVESIEEHPIGVAFRRGMNFSVNTDDPGPLCTTMSSELELVARAHGLDAGDLRRIRDNSLRSRFADELRVDTLRGGDG